ncbi:50S ribosomal protein L10 [Treponema phagedenis]|uniref:Large ribosomal subunit protein uL10 n=1 Tax=Treponema phagedenis TaxID=162 RepID=A0A0B7GYU5_TREPH|nr:50S ribosomal protein L10 [Treponema phagedenis]EFW37929.1 ribosomal protein L10 [Treponema phagedenis F0421]NVP22749.1 50S ribosomal protein L10 [Treponema phagedenis]QEJ95298.1 50S ribosomal protein L10 [Treponema phagedenis]QEJ98402.1 50S ribosomal protein L10 [Treponema phagedenis]QEK01151.1 50S ribosomal protein L10 [Treponema phagedenis]
MAMRAHKPQPAKTAAIENITKDLQSASSYIFTEYRGLTVEQITELRKKLRESSCTYKVVRNNFARIAFDSIEIDAKEYLIGPTAVALVDTEEANTAAKVLFEFAKEAPSLVIKGAIVDGEVYDSAKIEAYSKLPGKKELISMFMSTINATTSKFVRTLQAIVDKGDASGEKPVEQAASAAENSEEKPAEATEPNTSAAESSEKAASEEK